MIVQLKEKKPKYFKARL